MPVLLNMTRTARAAGRSSAVRMSYRSGGRSPRV